MKIASLASRASLVSARPTLPPLVLGALLATWLVWGSTYLAIKFALVSFPPFLQMGSRFVVAGALLALWMRYRGRPWPTGRQWWHALVVGGLMLGAMGLTAVSELSVASGLVVAFIGVGPLLLVLMNLPWGVRPKPAEWAGISIGLAGVLMLVQGAGFAASPEGLLAIGAALLMWTLGSTLSQRVTPLAPGAMGFASEMLVGGLLLCMVSWWLGEVPVWPPDPLAAMAWIYLVVFGSLIAFNAYMLLLERTSAALASSYCFVNPVIAMVLGIGLGGEVVSAWEWASVAVITLGVVLVVLGRGRPAA